MRLLLHRTIDNERSILGENKSDCSGRGEGLACFVRCGWH